MSCFCFRSSSSRSWTSRKMLAQGANSQLDIAIARDPSAVLGWLLLRTGQRCRDNWACSSTTVASCSSRSRLRSSWICSSWRRSCVPLLQHLVQLRVQGFGRFGGESLRQLLARRREAEDSRNEGPRSPRGRRPGPDAAGSSIAIRSPGAAARAWASSAWSRAISPRRICRWASPARRSCSDFIRNASACCCWPASRFSSWSSASPSCPSTRCSSSATHPASCSHSARLAAWASSTRLSSIEQQTDRLVAAGQLGLEPLDLHARDRDVFRGGSRLDFVR